MTAGSDNHFPKVIFEERLADGSDTPLPAVDHRTLFLGEDGLFYQKDSAGTVISLLGNAYVPGGVDVAVADGGTGASSASAARTNLGAASASDLTTLDSTVTTHLNDDPDTHNAEAISVAPGWGGSADEVQAALAEVYSGLGGGGGSGLVAVRQFAQATGSPAGSVVFASAPLTGSLLVLIGQNNGADYSSISQTNVTWTSRRADNVGGVGNLYIWTGAVSGAGGTTATFSGGSGGGSVYACELEATTYSGLGANGVYAAQLQSNTNATTALKGVPAGRLVCFIIHGQGTFLTGPPILSCPESWSPTNTSGGLAFGFSTGHDIAGWNVSASKYYTLVDIVPA